MPTAPRLVRWDKDLRKKLEIIAIYDGRSSSVGLVRREIKKEKIEYPILFDCGARMRTVLKVRSYPRAFLVGSDGKVLWHGPFGKGLRKKIDEVLKKPDEKPRKK